MVRITASKAQWFMDLMETCVLRKEARSVALFSAVQSAPYMENRFFRKEQGKEKSVPRMDFCKKFMDFHAKRQNNKCEY